MDYFTRVMELTQSLETNRLLRFGINFRIRSFLGHFAKHGKGADAKRQDRVHYSTNRALFAVPGEFIVNGIERTLLCKVPTGTVEMRIAKTSPLKIAEELAAMEYVHDRFSDKVLVPTGAIVQYANPHTGNKIYLGLYENVCEADRYKLKKANEDFDFDFERAGIPKYIVDYPENLSYRINAEDPSQRMLCYTDGKWFEAPNDDIKNQLVARRDVFMRQIVDLLDK